MSAGTSIIRIAVANSTPIPRLTDPAERTKMIKRTIYPVTRLLVGEDLADQLKIPGHGMLKMRLALFKFRLNNTVGKLLRPSDHGLAAAFGASMYENAGGLRYDIPDHVHADQSSHW